MAFHEGYSPENVQAKIASLETASRVSDQKGLESPFTGFAPEFAERVQAVLLPHPESDFSNNYQERICEPLKRIAEELGIELLVAGIDYPFHITLCDMQPSQPNMTVGLEDEFEIAQLQDMEKVWDGVKLSFSKIIPMASNGIILALEIPPEIARARAITPAVLSVSAKYPKISQDMSNICHATLYRIIKPLSPEKLAEFNNKIRELDVLLGENPLELNGPLFNMKPSVDTFGQAIKEMMDLQL